MSLASNLSDLTARIATEFKTVRALIGSLPSLSTTAKSNVVDAVNEVRGLAAGLIDDTATGPARAWSAQRVLQALAALKAEILGGADPAFDTLKELQDGLAADRTGAATMTTALGNRVRVDAAQTFTAGQQAQGRSNIGAAASADLGNLDVDLVAVFNAALA